jgi:ketosteroid isomerase-like protein
MMKKYFFSLMILAASIIIACQTTNFNLSDARKAILEQNTKRINAMRAGDIDTLLELYTDDATLLPPNDTMKRGKDAINMFYLLTPREGKILDASIISNEIKGTGNTLYEIGEFDLTIAPFESDATQTSRCKYITIWKHSDGLWKIYAECWNKDESEVRLQLNHAID